MSLRIVIWTGRPSPHQANFIASLRALGHQVVVRYLAGISPTRLTEGWQPIAVDSEFEKYVTDQPEVELEQIPDWHQHIHVISGYSSPFLRNMAVHLSKHRVSWVHWSEDSTPGWRWWATLPRKRWYGRLVNRYALGAFGYGLRAMNDLRQWGIDQEKIAYICYSVPACDTNAVPDQQCREFVENRLAFLYLGSLYDGKGCDVLLSAFSALKTAGQLPVLLMVGVDRSNGRYLQLATKYGIVDRVLFRGPIKSSSISGVFSTANVFVLPSRYDGWGVALNEAASMGLPLIASNHCGAGFHLVEPARNGFRVEAGDRRSLTAAMQTYLNFPELCKTHGARSLELFRDVTPEANAQRFCDTVHTWSCMRLNKL